MALPDSISRRIFLQSSGLCLAGAATSQLWLPAFAASPLPAPLSEFDYADVEISSELHKRQLEDSRDVLMNLSEDSLLKPFRQMAGQPAPGEDLGGWYSYNPDFDYRKTMDGFAAAGTFGQWVSALARYYAISGSSRPRDKVMRLNRLYAQTISPDFYTKNRFPAYCYDKLVCGLIDSQKYVGDLDAFSILDRTTDVAMPHLPGKAIEQGTEWRPGKDISWTWDESYTISENLFLAYHRGAGKRYRDLAVQYLFNSYYDPLVMGHNAMAGHHAYSHVNSLSSAMQAYLTIGDNKYLRAAQNAFAMLLAQSYATGGWGPNEQLLKTESPALAASLTNTHNSFETPCGSYAHFKITRYLLRVTRDSRYGDSMERVMYNAILGAKPLQQGGHAFYYSDYNFEGQKIYYKSLWPCCSGTYPQIAADYHISAYFHDASSLYVNLYIPSTLTWIHSGKPVSLTQKTSYPFDSVVELDLSLAAPTQFALNLRIPAWAVGASVSINGKRVSPPVAPATFVSLDRMWKNGDRIELELPLSLRLEPLDNQHPDLVALLSGPLVLFPVGVPVPAVTRQQLLAAKKSDSSRWQVATSGASLDLLPFTSIQDQSYSTYFNLNPS